MYRGQLVPLCILSPNTGVRGAVGISQHVVPCMWVGAWIEAHVQSTIVAAC